MRIPNNLSFKGHSFCSYNRQAEHQDVLKACQAVELLTPENVVVVWSVENDYGSDDKDSVLISATIIDKPDAAVGTNIAKRIKKTLISRNDDAQTNPADKLAKTLLEIYKYYTEHPEVHSNLTDRLEI